MSCVLITVLALLCTGLLTQASLPNIKTVLDWADKDVKSIANQIVLNKERICDALSGCTEDTCSRRACVPQDQQEIKNLQCLDILDPDYNNTPCLNRKFYASISRSYVRLPSTLEEDYEVKGNICAQKPIDVMLKEVWEHYNKEYIGWAFFGTPEGFLYVYPGRDFDTHDQRCETYDPRQRPWYIHSLAVVKRVYILIDTSSSMSNPVGSVSVESNLYVAQKMVSELLDMFTSGDQLAVSTMAAADQPVGSRVLVASDKQEDLQKLKESVNNLQVGGLEADINSSFTGALEFFNSSSDLKVLFIFSDGNFASEVNTSVLSSNIQELRDENVVIFFYKIGSQQSSSTALNQLQNPINMTFETVTDATNPLMKMRSYFDYLAWLRFVNTNQTTQWVPLYNDGKLGLGNLTTATFPAFDVEQKRLVGVVGIDIVAQPFIKASGLEAVQEAIQSSYTSKLREWIPPPLQSEAPSLRETCPNAPTDLQPLCPLKNIRVPMANFICCGPGSTEQQPTKASKGFLIIGLSAAGALVALVAGLAGVVLVMRRWRKGRKSFIESLDEVSSEKNIWIRPGRS